MGLYPSLEIFEKTQTGLGQSAFSGVAGLESRRRIGRGLRILPHNVNKSIMRLSLMLHKRMLDLQ
jgi:hypothetical protein